MEREMKYVHDRPKPNSLRGSKYLIEKYRNLIIIEFPDDDELSQIDQILELAIYDDELNDLINKIDQEMVCNLVPSSIDLESEVADRSEAFSETERDFSSDNYVIHYNTSWKSSEPHLVSERKLLGDSQVLISSKKKFLIGGLSLIMIGLFSHCHQAILSHTFSNTSMIQVKKEAHNSIRQSNNTKFIEERLPNKEAETLNQQVMSQSSLRNDSNEKLVTNDNNYNETLIATNKHHDNQNNASEANRDLKNKFTDPEVQDAYDYLLQQLDRSEISQPSQRISLRIEAERIQFKAESRQREAESKQREAELKQRNAELENHNDSALRWRTKAETYLEKSQQWLDLAKNSVAIVKQL
jgi:hypothetical protein